MHHRLLHIINGLRQNRFSLILLASVIGLVTITLSLIAFNPFTSSLNSTTNDINQEPETKNIPYDQQENVLGAFNWPAELSWSMITGGGVAVSDHEERASCSDPTKNASLAGSNDVGSQADCSGPAPHYNPGNNGQPGATERRTYSAGVFYSDQANNSNACTNIADDYVYFRTRLTGSPLQSNPTFGLTNDFWWSIFEIDGDGISDFYVRLNGNGDNPSETLTVLYETTGDNDPTGEPVIYSITNPLDNGFARSVATPDNATVGDSTQYFIDWQVPVTSFKDQLNNQIICADTGLILSNYTTSANINNPFQKDFLMPSGSWSDPISFASSNYRINKTFVDINGGDIETGDLIEYNLEILNLANNLTDIEVIDNLPVGSSLVTSAYSPGSGVRMTINGNNYNLSNTAEAPDSGGCYGTSQCRADYNISNSGSITFYINRIYSQGSSSPLYDEVNLKYQVTYGSANSYTNQAISTTQELPTARLSDNPNLDDGNDCTDGTFLNCNDGNSGNDDTTEVTVQLANTAPISDAGPDTTVANNLLASLDGSGSNDPDTLPNPTLSYLWEQLSGPGISINDSNSQMATFTPTIAGVYTFRLTVNDGGKTATDTVSITVNAPPLTNAGIDQTVQANSNVSLDGSGSSDPDSAPQVLTYLWEQLSGNPVSIIDADTVTASFTPTTPGSYTFKLTTSDGFEATSDQITIIVNSPPTANAGANAIYSANTLIEINGEASSDSDDLPSPLTFSWSQLNGPSTITLSSTTAVKPTFSTSTMGVYSFELTVSDGLESDTDTVVITINTPPNANAGNDFSATVNNLNALNGTLSNDPDNLPTPLTYSWSQLSGPSVTLNNPNSDSPSFTPTISGTYSFELEVSDGLDADTDQVTVVISPPANIPPIANAGADKSTVKGNAVTLDGSGSIDPDGGPSNLSYFWVQLNGPGATISNNSSAKPQATPVNNGAHVFKLTVSDGLASDEDTVVITANSPQNNAGGEDQGGNNNNDPDAGDEEGIGLSDTGPTDATEVMYLNGEIPYQQIFTLKSASPASGTVLLPGDKIDYQLVIENPNLASLTDVEILEQITSAAGLVPDSIKLDGLNNEEYSLVSSASDFKITIPAFKAKAKAVVKFSVVVEALPKSEEGVKNSFSVKSRQTESTISNEIFHPVDPISVFKKATDINGGNLLPGDEILWEITVKNIGISETTSITLQDELNSNLRYTPDSILGKGADDSKNPLLLWRVGVLALNESVTLSFRASLAKNIEPGTKVANQAILTCAQCEPNHRSDNPSTSSLKDATELRVEGEGKKLALPMNLFALLFGAIVLATLCFCLCYIWKTQNQLIYLPISYLDYDEEAGDFLDIDIDDVGFDDIALASTFLVQLKESQFKLWKNGEQGPWVMVIADKKAFEGLDEGGAIHITRKWRFKKSTDHRYGFNYWVSKVKREPISSFYVESAADAMINQGVQLYFVSQKKFREINPTSANVYRILAALKSENQKQGRSD